MIIKTIRGENFRVYKAVSWNVPQSGLHQIEGLNLDTGRSNMVGKSTLLDLCAWVITGSIPRGGQADTVVRRGEKSCWGEVELFHEEQSVTIRRERPAKLTITVNGEKIHGKAADLDKRIPEFIGMTTDQFMISVLIAQERKKSFFSMSDTERTEFLSVVAGLEKLDSALSEAKEECKALENEIARQEAKIEILRDTRDKSPIELAAAVKELEIAEAELGDAELAMTNAEIKASGLKAEAIEEYERTLAEIESTFAVEYEATSGLLEEAATKVRAELQSKLDLVPRLDQKWSMAVEQARSAYLAADARNREASKVASSNARVKDRIALELDRMEQATSGSCSHCGQDLPKDQRDKAALEHLKTAQSLEANIQPEVEMIDLAPLREAESKAREALALAMADHEREPQIIQEQMGRLSVQINSYQKQLHELKTYRDLKVNTANNTKLLKISSADKEIGASNVQVATARERLNSTRAYLQKVQVNAEKAELELVSAQEELSGLLSRLDEALDLVDLFGPKGFRTVCFEGVIGRISDRAGELLGSMTDGIYTTRLDQVGETAKGDQKLILKPIISKGGLDVPVDDLSGGAKRNVTLAYDIAVTEACGDSSVLFLDEVLYGLDPIGAAETLRLLEEVSYSRAVIVIEHASEIKAGIFNSIKVVHKNGISWLEGSEVEENLEAQS